jgi:phosphohistidine swiveling domain-containing protein
VLSPIKNIKNLTFWAREYGVPLFWLTDKNHKIISSLDNLVFFKGKVFHCYHLNNAQKQAAQRGNRIFGQKKSVAKYDRQAKEVLRKLQQVALEYQGIKKQQLTDQELKKTFLALIKTLDRYSNLYTQTEAIYMDRLDSKLISKKMIQRLGEIRLTLRAAGEQAFYILLGQLLRKISKSFNVRPNDLFFYTYDELLNLFGKKRVRLTIIEKRCAGFALLTIDGQQELITGNRFKKFYVAVMQKEKAQHLSGRVARPGRVVGRARLILHNQRRITRQVAAFKSGEILITEMTRPDTIVACRKAAAIITDEGGITSHAAVISRELNIPCVIGVGNATQIIRTGDLLEVDASQGEIKIIERNSRKIL